MEHSLAQCLRARRLDPVRSSDHRVTLGPPPAPLSRRVGRTEERGISGSRSGGHQAVLHALVDARTKLQSFRPHAVPTRLARATRAAVQRRDGGSRRSFFNRARPRSRRLSRAIGFMGWGPTVAPPIIRHGSATSATSSYMSIVAVRRNMHATTSRTGCGLPSEHDPATPGRVMVR